ncbi:MAG: cysteine methyltransferase, partial [Chitinophagales bacterium]
YRLVCYDMYYSHKFHPNLHAHWVVNRYCILNCKHHFDSETMMQELLESEGIQIIEDRIQNFTNLFWDPSIELL